MNHRQEMFAKVTKIRRGAQIATLCNIDGHIFTESVKTFESINQAKKNNGINGFALKSDERFPPMKSVEAKKKETAPENKQEEEAN